VRALTDLGVNADGNGHTFHAVLQEVAGNAPAGGGWSAGGDFPLLNKREQSHGAEPAACAREA